MCCRRGPSFLFFFPFSSRLSSTGDRKLESSLLHILPDRTEFSDICPSECQFCYVEKEDLWALRFRKKMLI